MEQHDLEHGRRRPGVGSPFDDCLTRKDILKRVREFLRRTGLRDHAWYIRIGAFLARRPFGQDQIDYLKREREEEDRVLNRRRTDTRENLGVEMQDSEDGPTDTKKKTDLRREYEDKHFKNEGNRGRWQIYRRQNWHVHALVLCSRTALRSWVLLTQHHI